MALAILATLVAGLAGGALQGLSVTRLKVPPLVVTPGGLTIFRGAALLFSEGGTISGFTPAYAWWGQGKVGAVPVPVIVFVVLAVLAHVVLRHTRFGIHVYAVGGNRSAAERNGVLVERVLVAVYMTICACCGLAGFLVSARLNPVEAVAGLQVVLTVIASVVIGGTSLFRRLGTIFGTVVGACLIGMLTNGLTLFKLSSFGQQIVIGLILFSAVAVDQFVAGRAE